MQITKSALAALGYDFAAAVDEFRTAVAEHAARPSDWDPCPPPITNPSVMQAAAEGFEIVDDPQPSLEELKRSREADIETAYLAAREAVLPRRKMPLVDLNYQNAAAVAEDKRSAAQNQTIVQRLGIEEKLRSLAGHRAQLLHELDDLPDADAVKAWAPDLFPQP